MFRHPGNIPFTIKGHIMSSFSKHFLSQSRAIIDLLDEDKIDRIAEELAEIRVRKGRVFVLGIGGSAANASHFVNDLRKLCGIEAYAPTDNVSEFSARTNDEGFDTVFVEYLKGSHFGVHDTLFIFSVGGGNKEKNISTALIKAIDYAKSVDGSVLGIVGKPNGYTATEGDYVIVIQEYDEKHVTPHTESIAMVISHCLVSNPILQRNATKW